MLTIFPWLNVICSCFKQSPLNYTLALLPTKSSERLSTLLDVEGGVILSSDNRLDFHDKILLSLGVTVLKDLLMF